MYTADTLCAGPAHAKASRVNSPSSYLSSKSDTSTFCAQLTIYPTRESNKLIAHVRFTDQESLPDQTSKMTAFPFPLNSAHDFEKGRQSRSHCKIKLIRIACSRESCLQDRQQAKTCFDFPAKKRPRSEETDRLRL